MGYTPDGPTVAVVGVTGAVGQEFLSVLKDRDFPYSSMAMLASKRSAGQRMQFDGREYTVEELTDQSFEGQCLFPPSLRPRAPTPNCTFSLESIETGLMRVAQPEACPCLAGFQVSGLGFRFRV